MKHLFVIIKCSLCGKAIHYKFVKKGEVVEEVKHNYYEGGLGKFRYLKNSKENLYTIEKEIHSKFKNHLYKYNYCEKCGDSIN